MSIIPISECGCPTGYSPSGDGVTCVKITTVSVTISPTTYTVTAGDRILQYGQTGANFYVNATGRQPISEQSNQLVDVNNVVLAVNNTIANTLWGNGAASPLNGRLNEVGVWTTNSPYPKGEWIGFSQCIDVVESAVYCIAVAADNRCRFKINGQLIVQLDTGTTFSFNKWHVIPFTLTAGPNIIELEGKNDNNNAAFGAEIYKATTAQLSAMTTTTQLAAVTIFSTASKVGSKFETGQESGYTCPDGYSLDNCNGTYSCTLIERTDFVNCCYLLTNCFTQETLITDTNLLNFVAQVITLEGLEGCWLVEATDECISPISVTVINGFPDCNQCLPECFLLTDCAGIAPSIVVSTDISNYIREVIKITTCPDVCWLVTRAESCEGAIEVQVSTSYATCDLCNPPIIIPSPALLHSRKVRPGYNTPGCSPEYTERVNCEFADQIFNIVKKRRYGIGNCCWEDLQKWQIKKDLLDLRAIYDPEMCKRPPCCAPTCLTSELTVFTPIGCPEPYNVTAVIEPGECEAPTDLTVGEIVFNIIRGQQF